MLKILHSFCLNQLHAVWEKHFSTNDWLNYLEKKEGSIKKKDTHGENFWDSVPLQKRVYYYDSGYLIPLKEMRIELSLHSTYFTVEKKQDEVILRGRGNGHRVGFCQEGAIHMAQRGYGYIQLLHFYYQGVQFIDSSSLPIAPVSN